MKILNSLVLLIFLTGCATVGPTLSSTSSIRNYSNYTSIVSYCDSNQIDWQWDPILSSLTLKGSGTEARFVLDSQMGIVSGQRVHLAQPLSMRSGELFFPTRSLELLKPLSDTRSEAIHQPIKEKAQYRRIVIDPGHGGKDPGAIGRSGAKEKEIVLDIAKRMKKVLTQKGFEVILTRETDQFFSLGKRSQIANSAKADFFVSIHANASKSRNARGFEVYYLSYATNDDARAVAARENGSLKLDEEAFAHPDKTLDATLWDIMNNENRAVSIELAKDVGRSVQSKLGVRNRGVKGARFAVLKGTTMPAVLLELGFITNAKEEQRFLSSSYRQQLAQAISEGIVHYVKRYEKKEGYAI